jgi:hypothetical protein
VLLEFAAFEAGFEPGQQFGGMDWFGEDFKVVALKFCLFLEIEADGERGKEEDLAIRAELFDPNGQVDSVDSGHGDVADEEIGGPGLAFVERAVPIVMRRGIVSRHIENGGQGIGNVLFVVDDEDAASDSGLRQGVPPFEPGAPEPSFPNSVSAVLRSEMPDMIPWIP